MKSPLALTGAIALKEAAACMGDVRRICHDLGEHEDEAQLREFIRDLEPITRRLHERAQNADA